MVGTCSDSMFVINVTGHSGGTVNLLKRMLVWWQTRQSKHSVNRMQVTVDMALPQYTPKPPKRNRKLVQADPVCPYCAHKYEKYPSTKTRCPSCNHLVIVRSRDKIKRLMTAGQASVYDYDKKESARINKARNYLSMARLDPDELQLVRERMTGGSGEEVTLEEVVMKVLESRLEEARRDRDFEAATWISFARTHFLRDNDREFFSSLQDWHRMKLLEKKQQALKDGWGWDLIVAPGCKCRECRKVDGRILSIDEALRELPLPVRGCANEFPFIGNYWWQFD